MKKFKLLSKALILLMFFVVVIPLISPMIVNGQEVGGDIKADIKEKKNNKRQTLINKSTIDPVYATNTAYGCEGSSCENGTGAIPFYAIPKNLLVYNMEFKIDAFTHEVVLKLYMTQDIFADSDTFKMSITDGSNTRAIDETNTKDDVTVGYMEGIVPSAEPSLYELEISTGILDEFYGSSDAFARDGVYNIKFENEDADGNATQIGIAIDSATIVEYAEVGVPKTVEYNSKMYSLIGDNTNIEADQTNVSVAENVSVSSTEVDGVSKYGVYELESICYEDLNTADWSENDLTLAKYDHVIRPCDGNYLIANNIDATVTKLDTREDKLGGFGSDGFRPIGRSLTPTDVDTYVYNNEMTGAAKTILGSSYPDNTYIEGLYLNYPDADNIGLIQKAENANVNNLGLVDSYVVGKENVGSFVGSTKDSILTNIYAIDKEENIDVNILGESSVGGIVGKSEGTNIESNSRMLGTIPGWTDDTLEQPRTGSPDRDGYKTFNTLDVKSTVAVSGGIVGSSTSDKILNVYNKGEITAPTKAGGIVGESVDEISIKNSYNHGAIKGSTKLGGIIGDATGGVSSYIYIRSVYNRGNIDNEESSYIGGIVGYIDDTTTVIIENAYNQGGIKAYEYAGGIVGYGNFSLTYAYNLGPIEVLKDSDELYSDKPYIGGIVGAFGNNTTPATISNTFSGGGIEYNAFEEGPRPSEVYVGDVLGQPKNDTTYITPTLDSATVYTLDEIKLPVSGDIDYGISRVILTNAEQSAFWIDDLAFPTAYWNLSTIAKPSPDSDPNDESSDDTSSLIDALGFYAQLKEGRSDSVQVEIPEQKASPYYRDIVDYKIDATSLDITIKYEDTNALSSGIDSIKISKEGMLRETPLMCSATEDINKDIFKFSGKTCGIEPDQDYAVSFDGLLNGEFTLHIHTPKQYIDDNGTPDESDDIVYALIGDGVNQDTFRGIDGDSNYSNQNAGIMPSTAKTSTLDAAKNAYGIYELESICYDEDLKTGEWTEDDLTLSKYDHVTRSCGDNYMLVGDVEASATNEDPLGDGSGVLTLDKDGGFSSGVPGSLKNDGFRPMGSSSEFDGKLIGVEDEVGTENMAHIHDFFIGGDARETGLIRYLTGYVKNIAFIDSDVTGGQYTGTIAGFTYTGVMENCYVKGKVDGSTTGGLTGMGNGTILSSYFIGEVTGTSKLGGLAGQNANTIKNSFVYGNVETDYYTAIAGGITGSNTGTIENSYVVANVTSPGAGGAVCENYGTMNNVYSTGTVKGKNNVGGLIGFNAISTSYTNNVQNSYSTADVYADSYEVGGLIGRNETNISQVQNSYAYEGQKVYNGDNETFQVIGTDSNIDSYDKYKTYEDIINEEFYTTTLGWDMSNVWVDEDYINHPNLVKPTTYFTEYEEDQVYEEKVDLPDLLEHQIIENYKVDANTGSVYLLLGDEGVKSLEKSTLLNVDVTPDSGYTGGGSSQEKVRVTESKNFLYIDGEDYNIQPNSVYTIRITNSDLTIDDSFKIHTPLKGSDGYIPIGTESAIHTDVDNRFNTTTVFPETTGDEYELYELESICYDHTQDTATWWTEDDLTLTKYDHVIRPCDANYRLEDDIDMTPVKEDVPVADKDGGWSTSDGATLVADGFKPISYLSGTLDGNDKTISNIYISLPGQQNVGLIRELNSYNNNSATIKDLTIIDPWIEGLAYIGLVGNSVGGTISNITLDGGTVTGTSSFVGGIVGKASGSNISNIISTTEVNGYSSIGGIAGVAATTNISDVSFTGNVSGKNTIGGIVGSSTSSNITNAVAKANVIPGIDGPGDNIGGIAGYTANSGGSISNVHFEGLIEGKNKVGGIVGELRETIISNSTVINTEITGKKSVGGIVGDVNSKPYISNNFSSATILATTDGEDISAIGGIVGSISNSYGSGYHVSNSYFTGDINLEYKGGGTISNIGGIAGQVESISTSSSYNLTLDSLYSLANINITTDGTAIDALSSVGGQIGALQGSSTSYTKGHFDLNDLFTTTSISYPPSVTYVDGETDYNIGGIIGANKLTTMTEVEITNQIQRLYGYEGQTINGESVKANRYVGNDPSTDVNISSYTGISKATQANFLDAAWYNNTALTEGVGVDFDDTVWDAPYTEDSKVCFPHLYDEKGAAGGVFIENQPCIEVVSLYVASYGTLDTVDVSQVQRLSNNKGDLNSNSEDIKVEELVGLNEDIATYPNIKAYFDANGYDYNKFEHTVSRMRNDKVRVIVGQIEEQQKEDNNFIQNNNEQISNIFNQILKG